MPFNSVHVNCPLPLSSEVFADILKWNATSVSDRRESSSTELSLKKKKEIPLQVVGQIRICYAK